MENWNCTCEAGYKDIGNKRRQALAKAEGK